MVQVSDCVQRSKSALENAKANHRQVNQSVKVCSAQLRALKQDLRRSTKIGVKNKILADIAIISGHKAELKVLKKRAGAGHNSNRSSWTSSRVKWQDMEAAFNNRIRTGAIINLAHKDPLEFLEDCGKLFVPRINNHLKKEAFLKVNTIFCGLFVKTSRKEELEDIKYINTKNVVISGDTNVAEWFAENVFNKITSELEEFQERDSGWALKKVNHLMININKYTPQLGSSYIDLPKQIEDRKACINVQNDDDACFAWAVVSALHPANDHPNRVTKYPHYSTKLKLDGTTFPITRQDIARIEKMNNISVNVYILKKNKQKYKVEPSRLAKNRQEKHVNLLLIQDRYEDEEKEDEVSSINNEPIRYHYVWIKNLSRLLSSQLSKNEHTKYFCDRCLHYFHTQEKLGQHLEDCEKLNGYRVTFPSEKSVKFKNFNNKERVPFIVYADFECILKPIYKKIGKTEQYQKHEPHSAGYYFKCSYDDQLSYYNSCRGSNCAEWFAKELESIAARAQDILKNPKAMDVLTPPKIQNFASATTCHICGKGFTPTDIKVRDHCHLTGKYRGAAHQDCNINYKNTRTIPIVFHNLSKYDAHLLIRDVANSSPGRIQIIPNNTETYIAIIKYMEGSEIRYKFIDSFRFMPSSLDKLSSYLAEKKIVRSELLDISHEKFQLLTRKGVFPYEHIKDWANLEETQLPDRKSFYNSLEKRDISDEDYEHAKKVWAEFEVQTLGEYSDLYLKTDVLLLADVFENFREGCINNYGLDAAHYYTAPGLAWDAMLKYTGVEIELLHDVDILHFVEKGIRGGLTQCSKRRARANNKHMANYDSSQAPSYLMYYDINAMYSCAMTQYLPYKHIQWVDDVSLSTLNFNIPDDSPTGYILEVDLEYPTDIHDRQKDLPMAPEKCAPPGFKEEKMLATLCNKTKYVVHYRNLKQYLAAGLKVTKIHRALQFSQAAWMRPYIELNANLRKNATNDFEKNLFKLLCNAVFGKTMENVRLRRDIKLVTAWKGRYGAEALISKPNFHSRSIFDDHLVAVELLKTEVIFNKPIYVGMSILDISKTLLYEFHYDYMKKIYGDNCNLCYTDTDSLIYEVQTDDIYEDMKQHLRRFDTSDYPQNNPYGIPQVNKKIPGLMKDENNGDVMLEFVGLRAKMYALRVQKEDGRQQTTKKAKGVKSAVVKTEVTFGDYVRCLEENLEFTHTQNSIVSQSHTLYSTKQTKITLSPFDNKRHLINSRYDTLPWGHYSIKNVE